MLCEYFVRNHGEYQPPSQAMTSFVVPFCLLFYVSDIFINVSLSIEFSLSILGIQFSFRLYIHENIVLTSS